MKRQYPFGSEMEAPNNASKADEHKGPINKGAESDLAELSSNAAFKDVPHWMECRVIGIADEI